MYKNTCLKLVEIEERTKLLEELRKKNLGLREEEMFTQNFVNKFKILGKEKTKCHDDLMSKAMGFKIRDNNQHGTKVRKRRNWLRGRLEASLGGRSNACRSLFEEVKQMTSRHRLKLKQKHRKKVDHLTRKFGIKRKTTLDKELLTRMGNPRIFMCDDIEADEVRNPVVVAGEGENVTLSMEEKAVLKLGPKFCLFKNLNIEEFEADVEECLVKVKWDLRSTDENVSPGLEDLALEVLLGREVCEGIDEENEQEGQLQEALARNPFNRGDMTFNLAKRRVTDLKSNSRVNLPRKPRPFDEESAMETLRVEVKTLFNNYVSKNCSKGGKQVSNLNNHEINGLKSLKKRVNNGEIVVIPTDKSGNLAIMTQSAYLAAGLKHTVADKEVGWPIIKESQKELNGHVSMMVKTFKMGSYWDHGSRIRETTMGEGLSTCPLSLLFKDHKGWSPTGPWFKDKGDNNGGRTIHVPT